MEAGLALLLALASAAPAAAQTSGGGADASGSFDGLLRAFDLKAKPVEAPDFVRQSRPATTDFIPVGRQHPDRPVKVMTPEEVEATTRDLDRARVAQQQRAGVKSPPVPLKPSRALSAPPKSRVR